MSVRIFFQRNKCIGCNACVEANRTRWRLSRKDGKCTLVGAKEKSGIWIVDVEEEEYEANIKASQNCPVKIIRVETIKHKEMIL